MMAPYVKVGRSDPKRKGATELSIINAVAIYKRLRSRSRRRSSRTEYLYVIQSTNLEGVMVYSKKGEKGTGCVGGSRRKVANERVVQGKT